MNCLMAQGQMEQVTISFCSIFAHWECPETFWKIEMQRYQWIVELKGLVDVKQKKAYEKNESESD